MTRIASSAGTGGAPPSSDKGGESGGIDSQINALLQRKMQLQNRVAAKEAYAQRCYDAQAGPGQKDYLPGSGMNEAKEKTGQIMAKWAMGPGAGNVTEGADYMKAEIANIDAQIAALQQQKQQNQNQGQGNNNATDGNNGTNSGNSNNSEVKVLENQVTNLKMEKSDAHAQNNYPREKQLEGEINNLNMQIAAMRGNDKTAIAA